MGNIPKTSFKVSISKQYVVTIKLSNFQLQSKSPGSYKNKFDWKSCFGILDSSEHEVHLLSKSPVSPWDNSQNLPTVDACHIMETIFSEVKDLRANTPDYIAAATTKWLCQSGKFQFPEGGKPKFSQLTPDGNLQLNRNLFDETALCLTDQKAEMNDMDTSVIIGDCLSLEGYQGFSLARIESGLNYQHRHEDGNPFLIEETIKDIPVAMVLQDYKQFNGDWKESELLWEHWCVKRDNKQFYDGCYQFKNKAGNSFCAVNLPFSQEEETSFCGPKNDGQYRESLGLEGSACIVASEINTWRHVQKLLRGVNTVATDIDLRQDLFEFCNDRILFMNLRANIDVHVRNVLPLQPGQHICHSLSYFHIINLLLTPINEFIQELVIGAIPDAAIVRHQLEITVFAVNAIEDDDNLPVIYENLLNMIQNTLNNINMVNLSNNLRIVANSLTQLVNNLNNVLSNLYAGNGNWNASVQDNYDPRSWTYVVNGQPIFDQNGNQNPPALIQNPIGDGIYLTNEQDNWRWYHLIHYYNQDLVPQFKVGNRVNNPNQIILYSSSNDLQQLGQPAQFVTNNFGIPVFFLAGGGWVQWQ